MRLRIGMIGWLATAFILFSLSVPASAKTAPPLGLYVDGAKIAAEPVRMNGTVYLPLRAALTSSGANIRTAGSQIIVTRGTTVAVMEAGKTTVVLNGESVPVSSPLVKIKGVTYASLRFVGNVFGIEAIYRPEANIVLLQSPGAQAVVYGYAVNSDGRMIQTGSIRLEDPATGLTFDIQIRNGFYRAKIDPRRYRFVRYTDSSTGEELKPDPRDPFEAKRGEIAFAKLTPSQAGHKVTLKDSEGRPIQKADISFNTSRGSRHVLIRQGIGFLDFDEPGEYYFNDISAEDPDRTNDDIFHPFTVGTDGAVSSLDIVAYPPNVVGHAERESEQVYGNLSICSVGPNPFCIVEGAPGGKFSFYLPDGDYKWESYYDSSIREHFRIGLEFSIANGQSDKKLEWTKPLINIHGTASTNEGGPLDGGYVYFHGGGEEYSAWVTEGKYSCYVPDGIYTVQYEQFFGSYFNARLDGTVTVKDGKLSIPTDLVFYLS